MITISSLSGGVSSAVSTDRVIQKHGTGKVIKWFADTLVEDDDLYRFLADCLTRWGEPEAAWWLLNKRKRRADGRIMRKRIGNFVYHTEGKTPEWIAWEHKIIPNQKIAPCTYELKIRPFSKMIDKMRGQGSFVVCLGYNVFEIDRIRKRQNWHRYNGKPRPPQGYQVRYSGVYEAYPLLWHPRIYDPFEVVRSWGIEIPRLYTEGFDNNNCNGECWRGGIAHWNRLRVVRPDRFQHKKAWEQLAQKRLGTDRARLRDQSGGKVEPLTLLELQERNEPVPDAHGMVQEDLFSCLCSY